MEISKIIVNNKKLFRLPDAADAAGIIKHSLGFKNSEGKYDADFFSVKSFGRTAEFVEKQLVKGTKVEVTGRLQQDRWTDKEGKNQSRVIVIASDVAFAESKTVTQQNHAAPTQEKQPDANQFVSIPEGMDGELPFV
jgi:single-strand DNA-binding protein